MGSWNDFNDAQSNTNLIPKGTLAKVRLTIRPGGFDDASQGWTGGYATPFSAANSGSAAPDSGQNPQILLPARILDSGFSDFISVAWKVVSRIREALSEFCSGVWKFCFGSMP